jgi:two-component system response regulator GlrR
MKHAKMLLLDFDPTGRLSSLLHEILDTSFDLRCEAFAGQEPDAWEAGLQVVISDFVPDIILPVLSAASTVRAEAILCSLRDFQQTPCIFAVEGYGPDETFTLLKLGAADFITSPLRATDILPRVWRLVEQRQRTTTGHRALKERLGLRNIIGGSPAFLKEIKKIPLVAGCDASVLISGETGTGKEVYARAIHYLSPREHKPFIPVNCGAIPLELIENELFGHERAAFTGANTARAGLLQEAEGGTLFLDEIDCLPLLAQTKLLRFLQEKEFRPLGSARTRHADVRVIGAANVDFEEAVRTGKMRKDLYYRLNVIRLTLPPLRERRDDIPLLARHFLNKYAAQFRIPPPDITVETMEMLSLYDWPGNVRELEHVIERAVLLSENGVVQPLGIGLPGCEAQTNERADEPETFQQAKNKTVTQFEKSYIQKLLLAHGGNITRAALAANKNRRAFWQLIRKHRIDVNSFKPAT